MTSIRTMATRIDDRKCQSPSRPRSTRSIAEGLAAAPGACAAAGGSGRLLTSWVMSGDLLRARTATPSVGQPSEHVGEHQHAEDHEQRARDHRDGVVVAADPGQPLGDPRGAQRHREERDRETGRVGDQQDRARGDARRSRWPGRGSRRGWGRCTGSSPRRTAARTGRSGGSPGASWPQRGDATPAAGPPPPTITSPPPIVGIERVSRHRARTLITPATWRPRKTSSAPPTMFMTRRSMKAPSAPISAKKATNTSEKPGHEREPVEEGRAATGGALTGRAHHVGDVGRHERQAAGGRERHEAAERRRSRCRGRCRARSRLGARRRGGGRGGRGGGGGAGEAAGEAAGAALAASGRAGHHRRRASESRCDWTVCGELRARVELDDPVPLRLDARPVGCRLVQVEEAQVVVDLDVVGLDRDDLLPGRLGVGEVVEVEVDGAAGEQALDVLGLDGQELVQPRGRPSRTAPPA